MPRIGCAVVGSGNIGTDLLMKILARSGVLEPLLFVGIDADSEGLKRARARGVDVTHHGVDGLFAHARVDDVRVVFDATSAKSHEVHAPLFAKRGMRVVDLTPAAVGPYVVPVANLDDGLRAPNVNMVTCGGQATIPIVAALSRVAPVLYAEIVASISSRSAGPGTRANIDEFTVTTARALESVGGARHGKAIIVLNPAEPPLVMRDTVYGFQSDVDGAPVNEKKLRESIESMVREVQTYVPGYRLVQSPVFERIDTHHPDFGLFRGTKVSVFLEVKGAGDFLPEYAGNLDIMTAAALKMGEEIAKRLS